MGEGLHYASLAALMDRPYAARFGRRRVTICAVGHAHGKGRFVMGRFSDGTVVLGEPGDFTIPAKRKKAEAA